jgi:hypothetical protein
MNDTLKLMKRDSSKKATQTNHSVLIEAGGWYGAAAVLLAYALVSFDIISPHGWIYQLLNFTGAVGVLIISYMKHAKQPALLNFVWAVIALVALIQLAL